MQLHPTPDNPLPQGAICVPVRTRDGVALRAMRASVENARGTVVMLGGRGDYIERYFETARDLMARGYTVASFDFRGQGGSQRLLKNPFRGHVRDFSDYDEDLHAVMTEAVVPHCPGPYFAIGHSTGGNVLLRSLRKHRWFAKAVACAPLIGLLYGHWPRPVVSMLVFGMTSLGLGWSFLPGQRRFPMTRRDFPANPLTTDQKRWQRDSAVLEAAPHLGSGGPTFSWLKAARKSTAALKAMGSRHMLNCPVLIVSAGLDRVVDREAIRRFGDRVQGVSVVVIREAQHEILSERNEVRDQFLAAFDAFIDTPPAAGGGA